MKEILKWILIVWSVLCLTYIFATIAVLDDKEYEDNEYAGCAYGCGIGFMFMVWIGIAGPVFVIYILTGKNSVQVELPNRQILQNKPTLCIHCGKYYEGTPHFCPHCGKEIKESSKDNYIDNHKYEPKV